MFEISVGTMSRSTAGDGKTCRIAGDSTFSSGREGHGRWNAISRLMSRRDRARGLDWHKRQVDTAAELGAVAYAGALYAHPGVVKRRRPPADEFPRTAEGLHALAEYAAFKGSVIALEPDEPFPHAHGQYARAVMRLIDLADHENLRVLFDTYHIVNEIRSYESALRTVAPRLYALHACENDRGSPRRGPRSVGGDIPPSSGRSVRRVHRSGEL